MTQHYIKGHWYFHITHAHRLKRLLLNDQANHGAYVQPLYEKLDALVFADDELGYTALLPLLEVVLVLTRGKLSLFKARVRTLQNI